MPDQAQQLDFEGNLVDVKSKRRPTKRTTPEYNLTQRDLDLFDTIYELGGVITPLQAHRMHWEPDIRQRLAIWQLGRSEIDQWLDTYSPAHLYDKMEQLKWGRKILRAKQKAQPSKLDLKLLAWIDQLKPRVQIELVTWLTQLSELGQTDWLRQAVQHDWAAPHAYAIRPRQPSRTVSNSCKMRLRHLIQHGFLAVEEQPTKLSAGKAQSLLFLTRQGRNVLANARQVKPNSLDWKRPGAYGTLHLTHRLILNDLRIAVQMACRHMGYELRSWIDDNQLKQLLRTEKVELRRLVRDPHSGERSEVVETHTLRIPDGYCVLDMRTAGVRHCFVELDNQTLTLNYAEPNPKDFAQKIRTLSAFYRQGGYKRVFPEAGESMWLLTVTTGSQQRLANLRQTTEGVIGQNNPAADRYWFACMDEIPTWEDYFSTAIFSPIWVRAGSDRLWSLDEQR